ncbi:LysR family transcriptional regulator [Stieleria sp. TO1_6]|nr:LysR family transcriptional regulator [Stieleria tagensis]
MAQKRRYFKQLRIAQFRALIELSRGKGFAATAAALDLSTPSVWQQVRSLEQEFGVPLVNVIRQHVELTEQGKLLAELAQPVVAGFDSIIEQFTTLAGSIPLRLSIASPANILVNELPAPIRRYHEQFQDVELSLLDLSSNSARKLVEAGEVDLAVVGQIDSTLSKTLIADQVTTFPFMLVCPVDHAILAKKRITVKSLVRYPLVMSSQGTNTRTRLDAVFSKADVLDKRRIVFETSSKDLLLQYVAAGFGITIVPLSPRYNLRAGAPYGDVRQLEFRNLSKTFGVEEIVILRGRHRREPEHQRAFRQLVLSLSTA